MSSLTQQEGVVYDYTEHSLSIQMAPAVKVIREDLLPNNSAFVLHNLLTDSECDEIIDKAIQMGLKDSGFQHKIRVCDKTSAMGHDFAELLYLRAKPFLGDVVQDNASQNREMGIDPDLPNGRYLPYKLNPCFRVVRYSPGGYFRPHHDGGFIIDPVHLSIKTFMMYLNDGFEGGTTRFFSKHQKHYVSDIDANNIIFEVKPKRGSCIIFNHALTHDGSELISGEKWLLRTEVMYQSTGTKEEMRGSGLHAGVSVDEKTTDGSKS